MTSTWPRDFIFGVATAGFQIEGGYNGPGEPRNNWADWEDAGRIARAGAANNFWRDYEKHIDLAAAMGLSSFRLSIEWTRVEPHDGVIDEAAVVHYRRILQAIVDRGLTPLVTLHHFTSPAWLGSTPWTTADAWRRLARWYETAVQRFGDLCHWWITSNEINIYAINCYFHGIFPPGLKGDLPATLSAIDHLLAAHVVGYQAMKRAQPESVIATNNYSFSIYELDRFLLDSLYVHQLGIAPEDRTEWLLARRAAHYTAVPGGRGIYQPLEAWARRYVARQLPLTTGFPTAERAIAEASTPALQDVAQLDYYAPTVAEHVTLPGKKTAGGRWHRAGRPLWDDRPDPAMFQAYVQEAGQDGLPVWVVENGMCVRRTSPTSVYPRLDGWTRSQYLRANIGALVNARAAGTNIQGYWHWTLIDNFEWGSYEPRFGLHGLLPDGTFTPTDTSGDDAAGTYRSIVTGLRAGDLSVVRP